MLKVLLSLVVTSSLVVTMSVALKLPTSRLEDAKRLCISIHDCHACLLIPDCYASFQPTFHCLQYPVKESAVPNGTVVIEKASCCPTSINFKAANCGFHSLKPASSVLPIVLMASVGAGVISIILIAAIIVSVVYCRNRKTCGITTPADMPPCDSGRIEMTSAAPLPNPDSAVGRIPKPKPKSASSGTKQPLAASIEQQPDNTRKFRIDNLY